MPIEAFAEQCQKQGASAEAAKLRNPSSRLDRSACLVLDLGMLRFAPQNIRNNGMRDLRQVWTFAALFLGVGLVTSGTNITGGEASALVLPQNRSGSSPLASRFGLREERGRWWFVAPDQTPFFSIGICSIHPGDSREYFDPENPSYAWWKSYPSHEAWVDSTVKRLKDWKVTTLGAWSDVQSLSRSSNASFVSTPVLHMGSSAGAPWWDLWDASNVQRMQRVAHDQIRALRGVPGVLGYYSDNELGWWNATLWKMTLEQPASSGQRRRLIEILRQDYRNDWKALSLAFDIQGASSWRELSQKGVLFLRPGQNGIRSMRRFLSVVSDRYYSLMRSLIHKEAPQALYLGDRFQSFYYPEVVESAGKYVDVISSNLNAPWNDGTFGRFYLSTLHSLSRRPVIVSEIYFAATENRSGNRNTHGLYPVVPTQFSRAEGTLQTLNQLGALPFVVGVEWFQYMDEPRHGRFDGENFNFGLVDIEDRPYEELAWTFHSFADEFPRRSSLVSGSEPALDVRSGIPFATGNPLDDFVPGEALRRWNRVQGFVLPSTPHPMGDLYVCWNAESVFLGLFYLDMVEGTYYSGGAVPKMDRAQWTVQWGGQERVRATLGAGIEPLCNQPSVHLLNLSGGVLTVRNFAAMQIPASLMGRASWKAGDELDLESLLQTHCKAHQIGWKGRFRLLAPEAKASTR